MEFACESSTNTCILAIDQTFFNFLNPSTGKYSVIRDATLDTLIDMVPNKIKIDLPKGLMTLKNACALSNF